MTNPTDRIIGAIPTIFTLGILSKTVEMVKKKKKKKRGRWIL